MRIRSVPWTRRTGVALAAVTAVISGVAVYVNGYGVRAWREAGASSATYTTAKNLVAALVLVGLTAVVAGRRSGRGERRPQTRAQWAGLAAVATIGGSVPFLLFFEGLARASSPQAAFIHKTLVVWVALAAVPLLRERLDAIHAGAIAALVAGQYLLLGGGSLGWGSGEAMILTATLLWAIEVVIAKRLLAELAPLTVGLARMGIGAVVLIGYGVVSGGLAEVAALGVRQWWWALATGAILSGYVATWYAALARAQAVDVTAMLVPAAIITALLRRGFAGVALPSPVGLGLILAGALLVVVAASRAERPSRLRRAAPSSVAP